MTSPEESFKIAVVKNEDAFYDAARDRANEKMTEDKESLKGVKGFFKKIWRHNLAKEYTHQKELLNAKEEMKAAGSLFTDESLSTDEKQQKQIARDQAVLDRFLSDPELKQDLIHEDAGEFAEVLGTGEERETSVGVDRIKAALHEYLESRVLAASPEVEATAQAAFEEKMSRVTNELFTEKGKQLSEQAVADGISYTENYLAVADQIFESLDATERAPEALEASLQARLAKVEVVIGEAKTGVRTEAGLSKTEKIMEKMRSYRVSNLLSPLAISAGVTAATFGANTLLNKSLFLLGGTAALGASAAYKEGSRTKRDREQHARERAQGKEFDEGDKRRAEMETARYETISAVDATATLEALTEKMSSEDLEEAEFNLLVSELAVVNARIEMSDRDKVDLIHYSDVTTIESERLALDIARAKARVALREHWTVEDDGVTLDDHLNQQIAVVRAGEEVDGARVEGLDGMKEQRDRVFNKLKAKRMAVAGATTAAVGIGVMGASVAIGEGVEALRDSFSGPAALGIPATAFNTIPGTSINLPAGATLSGSPGSYNVTYNGINIPVEVVDGHLTDESITALSEQGLDLVSSEVSSACEIEQVSMTSAEAAADPNNDFTEVKRVMWYDNDTPSPVFDKNELGLHWGGENGTGIRSDGSYEYDISGMASDGSFHGSHSPDVIAEAKAGNIKLFLSLSADTQGSVVAVDVEVVGTAPNERIVAVIDDSEIQQMFFENSGDGDPFKGKFAEIGHVVGKDENGVDQIAIFATDTGPGVDSVTLDSTCTTETSHYSFGAQPEDPEADYWPWLFATTTRNPLEKAKADTRPEELSEDEPVTEETNNEIEGDEELNDTTETNDERATPVSLAEQFVEQESLPAAEKRRAMRAAALESHQKYNAIIIGLPDSQNKNGYKSAKRSLTDFYRTNFDLRGSFESKLATVADIDRTYEGIDDAILEQEDQLLAQYHETLAAAMGDDGIDSVDSTEDSIETESAERLPQTEIKKRVRTSVWKHRDYSKYHGETTTARNKRERFANNFMASGATFELKSDTDRFDMLSGSSLQAMAEKVHSKLDSPESAFTTESFNEVMGGYGHQLNSLNEEFIMTLTQAIDDISDDTVQEKIITALTNRSQGGGGLNLHQAIDQIPELKTIYEDAGTGLQRMRGEQLNLVNNTFPELLRTAKEASESEVSEERLELVGLEEVEG